MELISREEAIKMVNKWFNLIKQNPDILVDSINSIPTVEERKVGEWTRTGRTNVYGGEELISRVTSLEEDMEFVLKHIRILEVDRQIDVISPSWDMKIKNYEMPSGAKATFEYDEDGIGKISLEAMDRLMEMIGAKEIDDSKGETNE